MNYKHTGTNILLLLFILLENLCLYCFHKQGILGQGANAILLFASSVSFGAVLLYRFYNVQISVETPAVTGRKVSTYVLLTLFAAGLIYISSEYGALFVKSSDIYNGSDIISSIEIMCKRLVAGTNPYDIIKRPGWDQHVGYLPFHWLPFTISELMKGEYRWVPFVIWSIAALWLCVRSMATPDIALKILAPVLILGANYTLFTYNRGVIEATVELMIAGYYMMLISGMNVRSGIVQGIVISFCLLSRYSLVLWLPLYAFTMYVSGNRKQLYTSVATAAAITLFIFVIPFLSHNWWILTGYKYYDGAAYFEWTHLNKLGYPLHLWSGTGYAYFFYSHFPHLEIPARIALLQKTHLICSLAVTVVMGVWYWRYKDRIDHKPFLMGSFKIYLSVFLFLIQVPYEYLMCVGNFVTVAIFCEQARYRLSRKL